MEIQAPASTPGKAMPCQKRAKSSATRVSKAYSRNGCARCKAQKTRCDEQKPSCGRCTRVGTQCPGYGPSLKWSTKHEVFVNPKSVAQDRGDVQEGPLRVATDVKTPSTDHEAGNHSPSNRTSLRLDESSPPQDGLTTHSPTKERAANSLSVTDASYKGSNNSFVSYGDIEASQHSGFSASVESESLLDSLLYPSPDLGQFIYNGSAEFFNEPYRGDTESGSLPFDFRLDMNMATSIDLDSGPGTGTGADLSHNTLALPEQVNQEHQEVDPQVRIPITPSVKTTTIISSPTRSHGHGGDKGQASLLPSSHTPKSSNTKLPTPARALNDSATVLVEFYFKETAQLFSCYDSIMNPFRTTVSRLWNSSPLLYRTLQSMAAANLVEEFPRLAVLGRQLRKEAIEILEQHETEKSTSGKSSLSTSDTLLAMLMLGGSASWHDPEDLGINFFNRIRKKLVTIDVRSDVVDYQFFHQCMIYWELLLSYVADNDTLDESHSGSDSPSRVKEYVTLDLVPHPWTGFARDTQNAVQKVGRLIRQQRKLAFSRRFTSLAHIRQLEKDMETASELEDFLYFHCHPLESSVLDPKDHNTPVWQLLTLAEAYRAVGLIQIYRIFPDILDRRLAQQGFFHTAEQSDKNASSPAPPQTFDQQTRNNYLTTYAVEILGVIRSIPPDSGTRDFQPFILVALSSELRRPIAVHQSDEADPMAGITSQAIETLRMRSFIQGRLQSFLHILPPKPIRRCLDIVNRTWEVMDEKTQALSQGSSMKGQEDSVDTQEVYWMDIMIENGWETTMA